MFAVPANTIAPPAQRSAAHPVRVALETVANRAHWAHRLRYDPERRWSDLLERTEDQEIWLLSWLPGQRTELHDHGGAVGAFTVVNGVLTERVVREQPGDDHLEVISPLVAGQSRVFGPHYVHQVVNEGPDPAVSVHVYRRARQPVDV
uniref:cysteine dioxygenase n=1 Tax=Actinoalloteichus spitiensis TaxID=252394 RepID=UPI0003630A62